MSRTTLLTLLALTGLTALPTTAQARYRDGLNLYQYVSSNPTQYVDFTGREKVGFDLQVDVTHTIRGLEGKLNGLLVPFIPALQEGISQANRGLPFLQFTVTDQFRMVGGASPKAAAWLIVDGEARQSGHVSGWVGIPLLLTVSAHGDTSVLGELRGGFAVAGECNDYCAKGTLKLRDMKVKIRIEVDGRGLALTTDKSDLTFNFDTCSGRAGERVDSGSKHQEFKGDDSLSYNPSIPIANFGANIAELFGADETAKKIQRQQEQARKMVRSAIKSVQRDQYWDDVDMELKYEIFSKNRINE